MVPFVLHDSELLSEELAIVFVPLKYHQAAVPCQASAFVTIRTRAPTQDYYGKLKRVLLRYLNGTK